MVVDTIVAVCIGVGLAAACGFRVFVPMLIVGLAARADLLTLADGFEWIASWGAITAFAIAAVLEIGAYYVPWLDNSLDAASSPVAIIAGVILAAAFIQDIDPLLKWSLAIIAGGGAAGAVKLGIAGLRVGSTALTAGTANLVVATIEWVMAVCMSLLSIFLPVLAFLVASLVVIFLVRFAVRAWHNWKARAQS